MKDIRKKRSFIESEIRNESGSFLVVAMVISSVLLILLLSAIRTVKSEQYKTKMDNYNFIAVSIAESGIEIAKSDMLKGRLKAKVMKALEGSLPVKLKFNYGEDFFPPVEGKDVSCQVISYIENGHIYFESTAVLTELVLKELNNGDPYRTIARKKVKAKISVMSFPDRLQAVWNIFE